MHLLGKEDGGQAREGAGETVHFAAQRGQSQTERGQEETERGQFKTTCGERTQSGGRASDPEHVKDQEDEEETAQENREERHTGSASEVTEAELKSQRAKKTHRQRFDLKTDKNKDASVHYFA